MTALESISPYRFEKLDEYQTDSKNNVRKKIEASEREFQNWRSSPHSERSKLLFELAKSLKGNVDSFALKCTLEMGKPIRESIAEVRKCAWVCEYYAENLSEFLAPRSVPIEASQSYVSYQPLGPILAIMPWNFPYWQVFRFLAPTIAAGNTALLKHASNVTGCALEIEKLMIDSGANKNLFQTLILPGSEMEDVISDSSVRGISLTGSSEAGQKVASLAGQNLKPCVLELGGSDPYVILEDANIGLAARVCAQSRLINGGQSCIAAKRFIVHKLVYDEFINELQTEFKKVRMGDPTNKETNLGPLARADLRDEVSDQEERAISEGASRILKLDQINDEGAFFSPSILATEDTENPALKEEIFGPVATVSKATDEEHAIELANASLYGLGAAVFTEDEDRGIRIAEKELQAGACFVNDFVKSDPRLPFGGVKDSGYGRELSEEGIRAFCNVKTVVSQ